LPRCRPSRLPWDIEKAADLAQQKKASGNPLGLRQRFLRDRAGGRRRVVAGFLALRRKGASGPRPLAAALRPLPP
jgi:hypothetical protein